MQKQFTPGPWRLHGGGNIGNQIVGYAGMSSYAGDDGFRTVGMFQSCCPSGRYDDQEENRLANGRLMAAAPDLLEALTECREVVAAYADDGEKPSKVVREVFVRDLLSQIDAAIAKALGGEG